MLKFITGNKIKYNEVKAVLNHVDIEQVDIDLHEIQEIDSKKIIEHKLQEALKHHKGEFIVDDSSLFLSCFDYKLPGPLIKWFLTTIGVANIFELCEKMGDFKARAVTYIGLAKESGEVLFFEGRLEGTIIAPKGEYGFGYDRIFVPEGASQTLSETKAAGNFETSPRGVAVKKLREYLLNNKMGK